MHVFFWSLDYTLQLYLERDRSRHTQTHNNTNQSISIMFKLMIQQLHICFFSSSSIVSQSLLPLVSGKHPTNNPQLIITTPNTPNEKYPLPLPIATITRQNAPPNITACPYHRWRSSLRLVGNSSMLYISVRCRMLRMCWSRHKF